MYKDVCTYIYIHIFVDVHVQFSTQYLNVIALIHENSRLAHN